MKTAIVTGATGNLGQAVIRKFLKEGYKVIGTVIPNDKTELEIDDPNFEKITVDLMSEEDASNFVKNVMDKHKSVDVAVLTVGGFAMGTVVETNMSDILKQFRLNFETTYHVARPVFVQMLKQDSGRIFLTGARTGIDMKNSKGMVAYGLSKSLIFRLAELMNGEAKGHNVVTAVIAPSTIDTPQNRKSMPDADPGKWVKPEDIANIIHFHASDEALTLRETILKVYNNA